MTMNECVRRNGTIVKIIYKIAIYLSEFSSKISQDICENVTSVKQVKQTHDGNFLLEKWWFIPLSTIYYWLTSLWNFSLLKIRKNHTPWTQSAKSIEHSFFLLFFCFSKQIRQFKKKSEWWWWRRRKKNHWYLYENNFRIPMGLHVCIGLKQPHTGRCLIVLFESYLWCYNENKLYYISYTKPWEHMHFDAYVQMRISLLVHFWLHVVWINCK